MSQDENQPVPQPEQEEKPEIFAVSRSENDVKFDRRDFLRASMLAAGAAATVAAGAALTDGEGPVSAASDLAQATRTPRPTRTPQMTATSSAPCTVRTSEKAINVHVGPGRHRGIVDYMPVDQDIPVIGKAKAPDGLYWWQIKIKGIAQAWVHPDDVVLSGDCSDVIDVDAPPFVPAATPKPTSSVTPVPQGSPGTVPPGQTGINYKGSDGRIYTLPCGSPLPPGAVCICNCVSVPRGCACDGYCSCAGQSHYWYPN
jgi:hypothetical protein